MTEPSPEVKAAPQGKRPLVIHPNWWIIALEIIFIIQAIGAFHNEDFIFWVPLVFGICFAWWFGLFSPWKNCLRNALVAWRRGQLDKAEKQYAQLHTYANRFDPNDRRRGLILLHVADFLRARGRYTEAQPLYGEAVEIFHKNLRRVELTAALNNLAVLFTNLGNFAGACRAYRRALAILDKDTKAQKWMKALVLLNLASIACKTQKLDEAEDWLDEAEEVLHKAWLNKKLVRGFIICNRAKICLRRDQLELAEQLARQAWPLLEKYPEHRHIPQNVLADVLRRKGRCQEAEEPARKALANAERIGGPDNPVLEGLLTTLAGICLGLDKLGEAETLFQRALELHQRWQLPDLLDWAEALEDYASLLRRLGRDDEARKWEAQAADIREPPPAILLPEVPIVELPKKLDDRFMNR